MQTPTDVPPPEQQPPVTKLDGRKLVIGLLVFCVLASIWATWRYALKLTLPKEETPTTNPSTMPAAPGLTTAQLDELKQIQEGFARTVQDGLPPDRVIAAAKDLVRRAPDSPDARLLLAQAYLKGNQPKAGYEQIETALKLSPEEIEPRLLAGTLALGIGDKKLAESHYRHALVSAPTNERARLHLAQVLLSNGQIDEAMSLAQAAAEYNSASHQAQAMLAQVYTEQGKPEQAIVALSRAIELTPQRERAEEIVYVRKQAGTLRQMGRPEEALSALRKLTPEERSEINVVDELAQTLEQMGKLDEAALFCEEAARKNATVWTYAALSARWWIKAGDLTMARKQLDKVQSLQPGSPVIQELKRKIQAAEKSTTQPR